MKKRLNVAALLATAGLLLGGCASNMSDMHPGIKEGSTGDVALGWDRSAAFDYTVDGNGDYTGTSPIHIEKARGSMVLAESTSALANTAQAFESGAVGYRQIKGTWTLKNKVSGTIANTVSGHTTSYNEHDVYGNVNVNHGGTVNHDGYIFHEVQVTPPANPNGGG